eukprot:2520735-Rhodomonas_salina.2
MVAIACAHGDGAERDSGDGSAEGDSGDSRRVGSSGERTAIFMSSDANFWLQSRYLIRIRQYRTPHSRRLAR